MPLYPSGALLGKYGLNVAFKESAGVLEILFGVSFGGGEALKRFIEQTNDPLLLSARRDGNGEFQKMATS